MNRKYTPYTNTMQNTLYKECNSRFIDQIFRTVEQPRLKGTSKDHLIQPFVGKEA